MSAGCRKGPWPCSTSKKNEAEITEPRLTPLPGHGQGAPGRVQRDLWDGDHRHPKDLHAGAPCTHLDAAISDFCRAMAAAR